MFSYFRQHDWILTIVVFVLITIGLTTIYSVDLSKNEDFLSTQITSVIIGAILLFVGGYVHVNVYSSGARLAYLMAVLLLFGVLVFGVNISGTRGWFRLAGFSFQPAEFAKVALVLMLGLWASRQSRRFDRLEYVVISGFLTFLLVGLIMLQPDLGSSLILIGTWFGVLALTKTKKRYLVGIVVIGIVSAVGAWHFLFADYQKNRFRAFVDPQFELSDAGYHVNQSIIAVGAGKLFGSGLGSGTQSQLRFLLEAQTDFIFAVIGEELGFAGAFLVLFLYGVIFWRLILIANSAKDDFGAYTALGICLVLFIQLCINVGGTIRLLPLTGVTLPFLSYGGSSLIMNLFLIGVAQSIKKGN